jgi:hypothetical protein
MKRGKNGAPSVYKGVRKGAQSGKKGGKNGGKKGAQPVAKKKKKSDEPEPEPEPEEDDFTEPEDEEELMGGGPEVDIAVESMGSESSESEDQLADEDAGKRAKRAKGAKKARTSMKGHLPISSRELRGLEDSAGVAGTV